MPTTVILATLASSTIVSIVGTAAGVLLAAGVVFLLARYLPIMVNLIVSVTMPPRNGHPTTLRASSLSKSHDDRFEGEEVTFETADGLTLTGTLGPAPVEDSSAPIIVFCHELAASRHSATRHAWFLHEAGFRVFSFDFRGHGDSEHPSGYDPRPWITEYEMLDLRAALRYLRSREDLAGLPMGLFGVSRGGVAAIVASTADPSVSAVVTDGAFSTSHTLDSYLRRWAPFFVDSPLLLGAPDRMFSLFRWLGTKLAERRLRVRFVSLVPALRRLKTPVLFLHGEADSYVESEQATLLYEAADGPKELWVVPEASHNQAVDVAPLEYRRRVVSFFRNTLEATEPLAVAAC